MKSKIVGSMILLILSTASISYGTDQCQEWVNKGEYDRAIDVCTSMISSPNQQAHLTYYNRGFAYSKKGQYDKAIADYTKAIELGPPNERIYQARASSYESTKEYDKAMGDLDKAVAFAPGEYSYLNRARFYRNRGKYDEAIADCGKVIELDPEKTAGYLFRSGAYYEKGAFGDSVRDYQKLIDLFGMANPDVKLDLLYVRLLDSSGKVSKDEYGNVLTELRSYVLSHEVSSDDEKWWRTISKYYLGMGDVTDARLIEEARKGKNEKAVQQRLCDAYYSIGEKKLMERDIKGAKEYFNKSIETNASSYSSRFSKAMLRLMQEEKLIQTR
jgi:tetratricopeptide (TPR) repeat protein